MALFRASSTGIREDSTANKGLAVSRAVMRLSKLEYRATNKRFLNILYTGYSQSLEDGSVRIASDFECANDGILSEKTTSLSNLMAMATTVISFEALSIPQRFGLPNFQIVVAEDFGQDSRKIEGITSFGFRHLYYRLKGGVAKMNLKVVNLVAIQFGMFFGIVSWLAYSQLPFGEPRTAAEVGKPMAEPVAPSASASSPMEQRSQTVDYGADPGPTQLVAEKPVVLAVQHEVLGGGSPAELSAGSAVVLSANRSAALCHRRPGGQFVCRSGAILRRGGSGPGGSPNR